MEWTALHGFEDGIIWDVYWGGLKKDFTKTTLVQQLLVIEEQKDVEIVTNIWKIK